MKPFSFQQALFLLSFVCLSSLLFSAQRHDTSLFQTYFNQRTSSSQATPQSVKSPISTQTSSSTIPESHPVQPAVYPPPGDCSAGDVIFSRNGTACQDVKELVTGQHMFILDEPEIKYIYCSYPKNGCTYHIALMHWIRGNYNKMPGLGVIHRPNLKDEFRLEFEDAEKIARFLKTEHIQKYMVVRNPMERTLSAYLNKIEPTYPVSKRTVDSFHRWIYVTYRRRKPEDMWEDTNMHWRPQTKTCGFSKKNLYKYFNIFRVDKAEDYVDFLYSFIPSRYLDNGWGTMRDLSYRDFILGPKTRTGNTSDLFKRYFNETFVFDYLAETLSSDIEMLGYQRETAEMRASIQGA